MRTASLLSLVLTLPLVHSLPLLHQPDLISKRALSESEEVPPPGFGQRTFYSDLVSEEDGKHSLVLQVGKPIKQKVKVSLSTSSSFTWLMGVDCENCHTPRPYDMRKSSVASEQALGTKGFNMVAYDS